MTGPWNELLHFLVNQKEFYESFYFDVPGYFMTRLEYQLTLTHQ